MVPRKIKDEQEDSGQRECDRETQTQTCTSTLGQGRCIGLQIGFGFVERMYLKSGLVGAHKDIPKQITNGITSGTNLKH